MGLALVLGIGRGMAADLPRYEPGPPVPDYLVPIPPPPPRDNALRGFDYGGVEWTERVERVGHCPPGIWMFCHDPDETYGLNVWHEARPVRRGGDFR